MRRRLSDRRSWMLIHRWLSDLNRYCFLLFAISALSVHAQTPANANPRAFFDTYCVSCHNQKLRSANLTLDNINLQDPGAHAEALEKVIRKLRAAAMPPNGVRRADPATYKAVVDALESQLDRVWVASPNPGRIGAVQRLNRTEYNNAIRDLFGLDLDVKPLLPGDDTADGSFDNFADVLSISTAHLERYMSVARQVTRLAVGLPPAQPNLDRFEVPLHVMQEDRMSEDLPFGSRGGMAIHYNFPVDGAYLLKVRLQRQYQDYLKGMGWKQKLEIRLDGKLVKRFSVGGESHGRAAAASFAGDGEPGFAGDPEWEEYMQTGGDKGLEVRVPVRAGNHVVAVAFVREMWEPEGLPQPTQLGRVIANDQVYMGYANVGSVEVGGPYVSETAPGKNGASRQAIYVCQPSANANENDERVCAAKILARMARLAYRRSVTKSDTDTLLAFFDKGRTGSNFDAGIQLALERMLVGPDFLLRVYREPAKPASGPYRLSDLQLASRLSFFLWSSIPDDHLLTLAERGQLSNPQTLENEVRRMLADPRSTQSLVTNFAAQWLDMRQLADLVVDPVKYPLYDESLLRGLQTETEMFIASTIREDRPVAELLTANYTYLNERVARHYGIPGVYGSRFRRVTLPDSTQRGGLLAQGALLAADSYPDRTSPVLRGKWLLNNIFGTPPPVPPPGVAATLETKPGSQPKSMRERLQQHRTSPACYSCHMVIDPLGFALENYDVIGGWRTVDEAGKSIDASGQTAGGSKLDGLPGLRAILLQQPDQFPRTLTEKLFAFALGRRIEYYDQPTIRQIVRDSASQQYRWSALITSIVKSPAFQMRAPRQPVVTAAKQDNRKVD